MAAQWAIAVARRLKENARERTCPACSRQNAIWIKRSEKFGIKWEKRCRWCGHTIRLSNHHPTWTVYSGGTMLVGKGDGTFLASPADLICILHDVKKKRFHVAFFEEAPMPGPVKDIMESEVLRLRSKSHHTEGATTLKKAMVHLAELRAKIDVLDSSVLEEPIKWDGRIGITFLAVNWVREQRKVQLKDLVR